MASGAQVGGKELNRKLRDYFGFRQFRPGQERAVQSAMDGRNTVVVMPTGSGKSVCFQLPALSLVGTTVVVSPLIALMKDQADALRERGVSVVAMNSTLTAGEEREAAEAIAAGKIEYAELHSCRWDCLVDDFGKDDAESDSCAHCDRCEPPAARIAAG